HRLLVPRAGRARIARERPRRVVVAALDRARLVAARAPHDDRVQLVEPSAKSTPGRLCFEPFPERATDRTAHGRAPALGAARARVRRVGRRPVLGLPGGTHRAAARRAGPAVRIADQGVVDARAVAPAGLPADVAENPGALSQRLRRLFLPSRGLRT